MKFQTLFQILVYIWTLTLSTGFFPNPYGQLVGKDDYTHSEITEIGILQAVAEYFEKTPATPGGSTPSVGSLTGITDITAKKLYDKYYGGTRSDRPLQDAINQIVRYNNKVDQDHYTEAAWHFNGEQIAESNKKLQDIRANVLIELKKHQPDYESARKMIGQFFHILQMFYSNTNWIEDHGQSMYPALGQTGVSLMKTAGATIDTCKSCGNPRPCVFNILSQIKKGQLLTSGYRSGQDVKKPFKDPNTVKEGKCSHGGPTDDSSTKIAALGGINKDSKVPTNSPHFYKHNLAAETAIQHTKYFFADATVGLRKEIGDDKFKELLKISSTFSLVFVIDISGSMTTELPIIVQEIKSIVQNASASNNAPANFILVTFSDPGTSTHVQETTKATEIINWVSSIKVTGGKDCPEFSLTGIEKAAEVAKTSSLLFVFTDSTPKDPYKQDKIDSLIATKKLRVFFVVTGTCSTVNQHGLKYSDNVNHALGRKRREVESEVLDNGQPVESKFKVVLILKKEMSVSESPVLQIPIDNTVTEVHIDIQGDLPYPVIRKPNNDYLDIDGDEAFETRFKDNMISITIENPLPGVWNLFRFDKANWSVEVTGRSNLDFDFKLSTEEGTELTNSKDINVAEVNIDGDEDVSLYNLIIENDVGDILQKIGLKRIHGTNENLYECRFQKHEKGTVFGIEGLDSSRHVFQRMHRSISSTNQLLHLQEKLRHRRSTTTWDLVDVYRHLASVSGGHVFQTTTDQIPNAVGILKSSISSADVLILHNVYSGGPSSPKVIEIPVDKSISEFTLNMHGKQYVPRFNLKDPKGNINQIDNKTITLYTIGATYLSVVVKNPMAGPWTVRKNDISEWDVEVTARSSVDFSAKLMRFDPKLNSYFEMSGRPIPDENITLSIEINDKTVISDLTAVSLLNVFGDEIAHYSLKKKDSRSARGFYVTTIIVPHESFKLAVVGSTTSATADPFVRMHRDVIETVNIKLDHIPEKVPLYVNEDLNVSFVISNAGSQDEDVNVTINDDKNFAVGATYKLFHLKAWSNKTSHFTVHGGPTKGETTTITLTAKPATTSSTNSKFQNIITYLTVKERPIDKTPPVCNATSMPVSCGNDPCKCRQNIAFITAEIWDEGDGLAEITSPNTPTNALRLNGFRKGLVKAVGSAWATLMVDCCRKNVTIDVKDRKNLTGSCDIPVDPNYDVNACTTTTMSTSTTSTTTTTTTTTPAPTSTTTTTTPTPASTTTTITSTQASSTNPLSTVTSSTSTISSVPTSTTRTTQSSLGSTSHIATMTTTQPTTTLTKSTVSTKPSTSVSISSSKSNTTPSKGSSKLSTTKTISSTLSTVTAVPSAQKISTAKKKSTTAAVTKEENPSTLSDGAVYGIAAAVGAVTLAVVIGGIVLVMKKMSAVAPKTEDEPN